MTLASQNLTVQGRRAHVWTGGEGPVLFLLHGGLGDAAQHWSHVWDTLAERHRVIAPDLPGMGDSEALPEATWTRLFVWLDVLLDTLGAERVDVVGNSFGGALARLYAANRPNRVRRAVLVNGGLVPSVPPPARVVMRNPLVWKPMDWLSRKALYSTTGLSLMVANHNVLTEDFVDNARLNARSFSALMNTLFVGEPPEAQRPRESLVVWGAADRSASVSVGQKVAGQLDAKLELIEGAGHMPQVEAPDAFVEALERALA